MSTSEAQRRWTVRRENARGKTGVVWTCLRRKYDGYTHWEKDADYETARKEEGLKGSSWMR